MLITERQDILESLHWLAGHKIRVSAAGSRPQELEVEKVVETQITSEDGLVTKDGIKLITRDGHQIPLEIPFAIEETATGFILDFNDPRPPVPKDRRQILEEDARALALIQRGRAERLAQHTRQRRHKVTIEVVS
ncbi:MAG: hypothetical protein N3A66_07625 [Planctomycetota bacterium]|nr:hypothetical protein [Planctomycetota bacterium]